MVHGAAAPNRQRMQLQSHCLLAFGLQSVFPQTWPVPPLQAATRAHRTPSGRPRGHKLECLSLKELATAVKDGT